MTITEYQDIIVEYQQEADYLRSLAPNGTVGVMFFGRPLSVCIAEVEYMRDIAAKELSDLIAH